MPITTRQVAELAKISEQSARNYTRQYGELLSPAARGETGPRLFNDEDVQVFCAIADLRRENVPQAEIIERLRRGDIFVDVPPQHEPQQATTSQNTALDASQALPLAITAMRREIDALRRTQTILLKAAVLWGVVLGAIGALSVGAFVLWLLWLLARAT